MAWPSGGRYRLRTEFAYSSIFMEETSPKNSRFGSWRTECKRVNALRRIFGKNDHSPKRAAARKNGIDRTSAFLKPNGSGFSDDRSAMSPSTQADANVTRAPFLVSLNLRKSTTRSKVAAVNFSNCSS